MELAPALLERWMRDYYFATEIDIGSSGVQPYSLAELRSLLDISHDDLDRIVFNDSHTLGGPGLRRAIADRYCRGDQTRVMATQGSSEAIFLIMSSLLQPGDEVIACAPCYQQHFSIAESQGCSIKYWTLDFDRDFIPDLDELEAMIGPKTRMVVVNFPHNPTGATIDASLQRALVDVAAKHGLYLVWDAAFAELVHEGEPLADPGSWYDRTITFGTLSKAFGLPGLRVGWIIAQPEVLESCVNLRDHTTLHLSPLNELIAERAVERAEALIEPRLTAAQTNLALLADWVESHRDCVDWVRPRGGVCAFVRFATVGDVEALCHTLARQHGVLLVPGSSFHQPAFVRLGFGSPTAEFQEGLARVSHVLRSSNIAYREAAR